MRDTLQNKFQQFQDYETQEKTEECSYMKSDQGHMITECNM